MSAAAAGSARVAASLKGLRETLEAERAALIDNDAEAIQRLAAEKAAGLRNVNALFERHAGDFEACAREIRALAELNVANGALIARRRRETQWTLRQLGLGERHDAYDARGAFGTTVKSRRAITA